jgi:hypothetical protein
MAANALSLQELAGKWQKNNIAPGEDLRGEGQAGGTGTKVKGGVHAERQRRTTKEVD